MDTKIVIGNMCDKEDVRRVMENQNFDAVIHFAAFALAGESMQKPYEYFHNNINGMLNILEAMKQTACKTIIFSSTCSVYGFPEKLPVTEESPIVPVSVYAQSKRICEIMMDWYEKIYGIRNAKLRYFNACGAMPDGTLGEDHRPETHIIPVALEAAHKNNPFDVFGNDYRTADGTCIRDYIHVLDLASAHLAAVEYIRKENKSITVNLGVGRGYSNLEVLRAVEKVTGKKLDIRFKSRRPGDPDAIYADNRLARSLLLWEPKYKDIESIIETSWAWYTKHPTGYSS
jgi:UDP-glucose 4-epimerase